MQQPVVLVVDDEKSQRLSLSGFLQKKQYRVLQAENGEEAMSVVSGENLDLVLTDFKMPGISGLELLGKIKQHNPSIMVILLTAFGKIENAVAAMKAGAYDYLSKPVDLAELEIIIQRALNYRLLKIENELLRSQLQNKHAFTEIITQSGKMEEILSIAVRAAASDASVMIEGESGTGKELIARAIHYSSPRRDRPLLTINCAAFAEGLLESELFGHEKGAFTGALRQRTGRFEEADGGTLFLDEIGDLSAGIQVKLLRFLQFGQFERVGGNVTLTTDARIITATNRKIKDLVDKNIFREDLYYRLNVINILLPPLRQRKNDIPLLVEHFLAKYRKIYNKDIQAMDNRVLDRLMQHRFPGNIRELENLVERAIVLSRSKVIGMEDLPLQFNKHAEINTTVPPLDYYQGNLEERCGQFEAELIARALTGNGGNQSAASRDLGVSERQLRYKIKKYGLKLGDEREKYLEKTD